MTDWRKYGSHQPQKNCIHCGKRCWHHRCQKCFLTRENQRRSHAAQEQAAREAFAAAVAKLKAKPIAPPETLHDLAVNLIAGGPNAGIASRRLGSGMVRP